MDSATRTVSDIADGETSSSTPPSRGLQPTVQRARDAQARWSLTPIKARAAAIRRVRDLIVERADELAATISEDNGKTRTDALSTEVLPAAMAADYYARHAARWLKDRRIKPASFLLGNKKAKIHRVPYGVIGIISPWNYPFAIPFSEVVMGLLAGNAVILKVATQTPQVGRAIERLLADAGLPDGVFHYVEMPGHLAGNAFLESGLNKLFFTGSVPVGRQLMAKAAETLTPVVLELGGNDPMLVCPDANLERAAGGALWAGFQNAGQSCGGVERIYVHRDVYEPFVKLLCDRVRGLRVGIDDGRHAVDMGRMTSVKQAATVCEHLKEAVEQGAVVAAQSACPAGDERLLPAVVLTNVNHSMRVMREETFGPVVGVMPVDSMDEAVRLANDSDLGLTASVWSRNRRDAERIARRIEAGVVMINDHLVSHGLAETPWGGFKNSGIGRTHGQLGFDEMTQAQCLVHDTMGFLRRNLWWHPNSPHVYSGLRGFIDFLYASRMGQRLAGLRALAKILPRVRSGD